MYHDQYLFINQERSNDDAPYHRGVKVIGPQFGPKFVHDPEWYRHHEPKQIRPSNELVSFTSGKQLMAVRVINKFEEGRFSKKPYLNPPQATA